MLVTSDNPRSEDPEAIIDEIMRGAGSEAVRESDRRRAIARAVEQAGPGDVVVIAGKGHEQGQEFEDGRKEPFDDVTVAREAIPRGPGSADVIDLSAARIAAAAGGELAAGAPERAGPERATIDSRAVEAGDLFVGLPGAQADGGAYAARALEAGAWARSSGPPTARPRSRRWRGRWATPRAPRPW